MRSREKYLRVKVVLWKSWVWDREKDPGLQKGPSLGISGKRMGMVKTHEVRTQNSVPVPLFSAAQTVKPLHSPSPTASRCFQLLACYGPSKNKHQKLEPEHISTLLRSLNRRRHIFIQKASVVSLLSAISLPGVGNRRNGSRYQEDC